LNRALVIFESKGSASLDSCTSAWKGLGRERQSHRCLKRNDRSTREIDYEDTSSRKCIADTNAVTDQDFENESEDERGSGEATIFGQLYLEETVLDLYSGVAGTQKKHKHEWYQQLVSDL
jgi:hypothetical protein